MTLNQLYYFKTVCEMKNIKAAAEKLCVSQPAVSNAMHDLEEEMNLSLLNRSVRGTTPTVNGEVIKQKVDDLLFRFERLQEIAKDLSSQNTPLRFGVTPMIATGIFPETYSSFQKEYPEIEMQITTEKGLDRLYQMLRMDELDLILAPAIDLPPDFKFKIIKRESVLFCISAADAKPEYHDGMTPELFGDKPLAILPKGSLQHDLVRDLYAKHSINPNVLIRTNQLSVIRSFVQQCGCGAFFYDSYISKAFGEGEIAAYHIDMPEVPIAVVWKEQDYMYHSTKTFLKYIGSGTRGR